MEENRNNQKFGIIDINGNCLVNPCFSDILAFYEGLCPVKIGDKWGAIDERFQLIISPQYLDMHCFQNGFAYVQIDDDKWGYIDSNGRLFSEEEGKGKMGMIFNHKVYDPKSELYEMMEDNRKCGLLDYEFKIVITPEWDDIRREYDPEIDRIAVKRDGKWGFINIKGELVIPPQFGGTRGFSGKYGIISTQEEPYLPCYPD